MKKRWLPLIIGAWLTSALADVEITTDRAVIGSNDELVARLHFPAPDQGDLYVAASVQGQLYFYGEDGKFHSEPVPYRRDGVFDQDEVIFRFPGALVPTGRYILYAVVTDTDRDVFDSTRWHSPVARQLFIANEPENSSRDFDGDGWPDDDDNHDGFSDADQNFDGYRDDDADHNGIPDTEEHDQGGIDDGPGSSSHDPGASDDHLGSSSHDSGTSDDSPGSSSHDSGTSDDHLGSSSHDSGTSDDSLGSSGHDHGSGSSGSIEEDHNDHRSSDTEVE